MIKLLTFDNFLTPPRFFRPWKAVEGGEWRRGLSLFPAKMTPVANTRQHFIYLLLRISRTGTRPRLRVKGLYCSTITSILHMKNYCSNYLRRSKRQKSIMTQTKFSFSWVAGKRNLQYYRTEHSETCDIHPCMYIYKFLSGTGQSENISSWYMKKIKVSGY